MPACLWHLIILLPFAPSRVRLYPNFGDIGDDLSRGSSSSRSRQIRSTESEGEILGVIASRACSICAKEFYTATFPHNEFRSLPRETHRALAQSYKLGNPSSSF